VFTQSLTHTHTLTHSHKHSLTQTHTHREKQLCTRLSRKAKTLTPVLVHTHTLQTNCLHFPPCHALNPCPTLLPNIYSLYAHCPLSTTPYHIYYLHMCNAPDPSSLPPYLISPAHLSNLSRAMALLAGRMALEGSSCMAAPYRSTACSWAPLLNNTLPWGRERRKRDREIERVEGGGEGT